MIHFHSRFWYRLFWASRLDIGILSFNNSRICYIETSAHSPSFISVDVVLVCSPVQWFPVHTIHSRSISHSGSIVSCISGRCRETGEVCYRHGPRIFQNDVIRHYSYPIYWTPFPTLILLRNCFLKSRGSPAISVQNRIFSVFKSWSIFISKEACILFRAMENEFAACMLHQSSW